MRIIYEKQFIIIHHFKIFFLKPKKNIKQKSQKEHTNSLISRTQKNSKLVGVWHRIETEDRNEATNSGFILL